MLIGAQSNMKCDFSVLTKRSVVNFARRVTQYDVAHADNQLVSEECTNYLGAATALNAEWVIIDHKQIDLDRSAHPSKERTSSFIRYPFFAGPTSFCVAFESAEID
jgi:hypothetical protein